MDISGYSEYGKEQLMKWYSLLADLPKEELAMRIAVALDTQDSCDECWIKTMREKLIQGKCGLWMCDKCCKWMEDLSGSERVRNE